jgi:signal transduction histidine kinase
MSSRWTEPFRSAVALRLALWYFLFFAVGSLVLVGVTYLLLARSLQTQDRDTISTMLDRYASAYAGGGLGALDQVIAADRLQGRHEQTFVRVVGRAATATYFNLPAGWDEFDLSELDLAQTAARWWQSIEGRRGTVLEVATARLSGGTLVQVGRSSALRESLLSRFRQIATLLLGLVLAIALAGGAILTTIGLQPVRDMETTLRSIVTTGRLDQRVPTRGSRDALDDLAGLVNLMLDRLERLVGGMRGALDSVAHDLRTPLTRLRNVIEQSLAAGSQEAAREGLAQALEETERLTATLTTLIDISGAESGTMPLDRVPLQLLDVVREAAELYVDAAEEKGVVLTVHEMPPDLALVADRVRLRQVLANLLDNAVKYTPGGGRIDVRGWNAGEEVLVSVEDTGIGIEPDDLPRVWDRLFRADASRSERGFGLGLSLVKAIVEGHGGTVSVRSQPGEGSVFTIRLPATAPILSPL